jgi:hypothetical protein
VCVAPLLATSEAGTSAPAGTAAVAPALTAGLAASVQAGTGTSAPPTDAGIAVVPGSVPAAANAPPSAVVSLNDIPTRPSPLPGVETI